MRLLIAPLLILLGSSLFAQRGAPPPVTAAPFGNILTPGTPFPAQLGATVGGNILHPGTPSFPQQLGNNVSGIIPNQGGFVSPPLHRGQRPGRDRTIAVPYAYPVYFGDGGYGYGYGQQQQQPPITVVMPQQQTPTVIINQSFPSDNGNAGMRDVSGSDAPDPSGMKIYRAPVPPQQPAGAPSSTTADDEATIYLVALKDNSIHSAIGYWVQDGTLHYVTPQGTVNRVTLDQVDRPLTDQLNKDRKVDFQLKAK